MGTLPQDDKTGPNIYIHINPQSKGNLGKSFETELRAAWLDARGVTWSGSDFDDAHGTFRKRHRTDVKSFEFGNTKEAKEAFIPLIRIVLRNQHPVHLIDSRAQAHRFIMEAVEELNLFSLCSKQGIRLVLFLFPSDEVESMENVRSLVKFGAGMVNFVVVHNPARTAGKLYRGSPFEAVLGNVGAKTITLPIISTMTVLAMQQAEVKEGRGISFAEFATPETRHLDPIMVEEMQWVLTRMYEQYDAISDLLLPASISANAKTQVPDEVTNRKSASLNDNDFGFNFGDDTPSKNQPRPAGKAK